MALEPRRILLVNNQGLSAQGGGPTILRQIVSRFAIRHDVTVASFDPPSPEFEGVGQIELPAAEIGNWRFAPLYRARHLCKALAATLEADFDIVISMDCHTGWALSAGKAKLKAYIALSCAPRQEWFGRQGQRFFFAAQYAFLERLLIRQCHTVIVASENQRREIGRYECLPKFAPHVLRPIFGGQETVMEATRPASTAGFLFATVCRLAAVKRVDRVLAIADRLRDHDCRFLIVGDGPQSDALRQGAMDLGVSHIVEFVGASDQPEIYLEKADFLLHPSAYESFGIAIYEAMRQGAVPVLNEGQGSKIGIAPDMQNGENGLLVDFDDLEGVCRVLKSVLTDSHLRGRLKRGAQQRAAAMAQRDYVGDLANALNLQIA